MTKATEASKAASPETTTFTPVIKKLVTLPLLKFSIDKPIYVRIDAPMFVGKEIQGNGTSAKMEPATLANCTNLETGEVCQIIVATVLKSILEEEYEGEDGAGYVGKGFMLTKGAKGDGKKYNPYTVAEIEIPA